MMITQCVVDDYIDAPALWQTRPRHRKHKTWLPVSGRAHIFYTGLYNILYTILYNIQYIYTILYYTIQYIFYIYTIHHIIP